MGFLARLSARLFGTPQDRFAREVLRTVRSSGVTAWYEPEEFRIGLRRPSGSNPSGDGTGWIYLSNVYRECVGVDRGERDFRIGRLVESLVASDELPDSWAEV